MAQPASQSEGEELSLRVALRLALVPLAFINVIVVSTLLNELRVISDSAWLLFGGTALVGLLIVPGVVVGHCFRVNSAEKGAEVAVLAWLLELPILVVLASLLEGPPKLADDSLWNVAGVLWGVGFSTSFVVGLISGAVAWYSRWSKRAIRPAKVD